MQRLQRLQKVKRKIYSVKSSLPAQRQITTKCISGSFTRQVNAIVFMPLCILYCVKINLVHSNLTKLSDSGPATCNLM